MFKIGVDIGGTFTDLVLIDDAGRISEYKVPTTPRDFSRGFIEVLQEAAAAYHIPASDFTARIDLIIHGTTIATNALVTRNLARTAMITTRGFRDIIEIRRALKIETRSMYEAFIPPYEPLIPRYLRFTVHEETRYTGEVTVPVDPRELQGVIGKIKAAGVEAVAICFLNSYANPQNEKQTAEICRRELPEVFITFSSDILPVMGEYERESTCVINACVGPVVSRYLTNLEKMLEASGFKASY
jgi:N-methylhydantoinase A